MLTEWTFIGPFLIKSIATVVVIGVLGLVIGMVSYSEPSDYE